MVISSSSVPSREWYAWRKKKLAETLDNEPEDEVDSDVEVDSETGDSEEDL